MDTKQQSRPIDSNPATYNPQDLHPPQTTEEIAQRIINSYKLIKPYIKILDCEIVQFFNQKFWNLLPNDWCEYLTSATVEELSILMDADNDNVKNLPESLKKLRCDVKTLSLSRKSTKYHRYTPICCNESENKNKLLDYKEIYDKATSEFPFYENLLNFDKKKPPLSFLKYKCKDKKLSEIVIMGDLCFKACVHCEYENIDFIVDIGAGLGHLSRCLAYFYGINVVSIEMDSKLTEEALRLDTKFLKLLNSLSRRDPKFNHHVINSWIVRITKKITPDITSQQFVDMIFCALEEQNLTKTERFKFGLVGLHPCGDLAPTILNLYKTTENCQFITIASCCYNKMSISKNTLHGEFETSEQNTENDQTSKNHDEFSGFPLNGLKKLTNKQNIEDLEVTMGRNQLGLALHALESHQERFVLEKESFKADFYRALVEKFIADVAPEYKDKRRKNVKTVGPGGVTNFVDYVKLSIPEIMLDENVDRVMETLKGVNEEEEFHKILAFSALRHMFAPLLESIVLLDRVLYLKYDSSYCHVTQRFEPKTSPRVHVITAFKK